MATPCALVVAADTLPDPCLCLMLMPSTTQVSPCASTTSAGRIYGDLFVPLLYVLFAVGDFLGRLISGYGPWAYGAPQPLSILAYSVARWGTCKGHSACACAYHSLCRGRKYQHMSCTHDVRSQLPRAKLPDAGAEAALPLHALPFHA